MRPDPDLTAPEHEANRWEPLRHETARAYQVFAIYRDLGPLRTLRRAAAAFYHAHPELDEATRLEALTVPQLQQAKEWSRHYEWVDRATAWDLHLDAISRAEQEYGARVMRDNYRILAVNLRNRVHQSMNAWVEEQRVLTPMESIRALEVCHKLEAWALELPDSVATRAGDPDDVRELAEVGRGLVAELRLVASDG
jgi:hypothetical protein